MNRINCEIDVLVSHKEEENNIGALWLCSDMMTGVHNVDEVKYAEERIPVIRSKIFNVINI